MGRGCAHSCPGALREKYDGHTQRNSQGARADRRRACRNPEVIRARYETRSLAVMGEGRMGRVAVGLSVPVAMTRPANRKEATPMINFLLQHQFSETGSHNHKRSCSPRTGFLLLASCMRSEVCCSVPDCLVSIQI